MAVLSLNFGTPENNEFSIWDKWKIYYFKVSQYLSTLGYMKGSCMCHVATNYEKLSDFIKKNCTFSVINLNKNFCSKFFYFN